jgi:hypothetical protein
MEPGYNMKMEVLNRLPGGDAIVYYDVESIAVQFSFDYTRDYLNGSYGMIEFMFRNGDKITIVLFCNYKRVPEIDRVNIEEGENIIAFVEDFRMGFMFNYVTKDTFHNYKIRLKNIYFHFSLRNLLNFSFERKVAKETLAANILL